MPRHRKERVPLHRVRRPPGSPARRARLLTALSTAKKASKATPASQAADAPETLPFTALRGRALRAGLLGTGRLATKPGPVAGAVRGMVVAPWFAAATGLVVAAGLWIYSPHAELKFPDSAIGVLPCAGHGCAAAAGHDPSVIATTTSQPDVSQGMPTAAAAVEAAGARRATLAGLTFRYSVLWQEQGKFTVLIRVTAKHAMHAWKLAFAMPGDDIGTVAGANWDASGSDGGTASGTAGTSFGALPSQLPGDLSTRSRRAISFIVIGQGAPVAPTGCSFNGVKCSFTFS
jgi:hypothetical protein